MTDLDRTSLDRLLPAVPGSPDWNDVLSRCAAHRGRRRRLVALAMTALVVVVGTASAFAVRAYVLDTGFIGLPPVGATPSSPERGELLVEFIGRSSTLGDALNRVWLYADGRMVSLREGAVAAGANEVTSGFLEQRLAPEGVELLLSELLATGLFDRDRNLWSAHSPWGTVRVQRGDALVRVKWDDPRMTGAFSQGDTAATPEQVKALEQVDALLADPGSRLPTNAWDDPRIRAYVASKYAICSGYRPDGGAPTIDASRILELLPPQLARLVRARGWISSSGEQNCSVVATEEARNVAGALEDAGLEQTGGGKRRVAEGPHRLAYSFAPPDGSTGRIIIFFEPVLPHGEWVCTPCG